MQQPQKGAPALLKNHANWFAEIIAKPLDKNGNIQCKQKGIAMDVEVSKYITKSHALQPIERIQIYNQQFWWRLFNTLHEDFPLVTRLFGYQEFNEKIGVPYLSKYLPNHWSLASLGNRLAKWVLEDYLDKDKPIVLDAVNVDWAITEAETQKHTCLKCKTGDVSKLMHETLYLQSHSKLLTFQYNLLQLREEFLLKDPDFWLTNPFPKAKRDRIYFYIIYRNHENDVVYEDVAEEEFRLIEKFDKGSSILKAIDWLEEQDEKFVREASSSLDQWLKKWIARGWLSPL